MHGEQLAIYTDVVTVFVDHNTVSYKRTTCTHVHVNNPMCPHCVHKHVRAHIHIHVHVCVLCVLLTLTLLAFHYKLNSCAGSTGTVQVKTCMLSCPSESSRNSCTRRAGLAIILKRSYPSMTIVHVHEPCTHVHACI